MPRTTTVTVNDDGSIQLPPQLRRQFPVGSRFSVSSNDGTIVLKEVTPKKPDDDSWRQFDESLAKLRQWAKENNITAADLKRTQQRLRRERRGQVARRSR